MLAATLATLAITFATPAAIDAPSPEDRAAYRAARDAAGRDPDAHVRLALWCEQHGMTAERIQHLALAVMAEPAHAAARGLMGLVRDADGRWVRPESLAEKIRSDATLAAALAEYHRRRSGLGPDADADDHWRLASWCAASGLEPEARAHLATVVRLDPTRDAAWKRLGYKKVNGRWMTDEQVAAAKAEREAQSQADRTWSARLRRLREQLGDDRRRPDAERALSAIHDPRAVRAVWAYFAGGDAESQARVVQILGQIEAPTSSRALAWLAVGSPSAEVRRRAVETLDGRDPRDVVPMLIALLREPIRYEVRPVGGPGSPGVLLVEGANANQRRFYAPPALTFRPLPGDVMSVDEFGLPTIVRSTFSSGVVGSQFWNEGSGVSSGVGASNAARASYAAAIDRALGGSVPSAMPGVGGSVGQFLVGSFDDNARAGEAVRNLKATQTQRPGERIVVDTVLSRTTTTEFPVGQMVLEARRAAASAEAQLETDVRALDAANDRILADDERVLGVLDAVVGRRDLGNDPEAWASWWAEEQGYSYRETSEGPKPLVDYVVPLGYAPRAIAPVTTIQDSTAFAARFGHSCFGAGTEVRTAAGLAPIESIRVGDRVLTQDTRTGALRVEPVVAVHHNPPTATLRLDLGDESIVATPIHRFWSPGRGWVMARELNAGDQVRRLSGLATVASVDDAGVQPVFNLEVHRGNSFLVGQRGALVHDNSLVEPTPEPFDRPADLARSDAVTP